MFLSLIGLVAAGFAFSLMARSIDGVPPNTSQAAIDPAATKWPSAAQIISYIDHPTPVADGEGRLVESVGDFKIIYTLVPELQLRAEKLFSRYSVPYGALVALEPSTGRVLALAEYSAKDEDAGGLALKASYPAASLIKMITATAALETGRATPDTSFRYEGSPYKLKKRKISPKNKRREHNVSTLSDALGRSNNVVFGKIGADIVGQEGLLASLEAFHFNEAIPFDFPLQTSLATVPEEPYPLARTSAGFGDVYISPIHAALIAAAIANGGVMMRPYIVDSIEDVSGNLIFANSPQPLGRVTDEETAAKVAGMMTRTIRSGTSTKTFYRHARKLVNSVKLAGKTGSLTGDDPPGLYEWFVGFGPVKTPEIVVAGLVVNQGDLWHIKGSYAAMVLFREHFGL